MGACFSLLARETELINCTEETLLFYECESDGPNWTSYPPIELKPNMTKKIVASRFSNNQRASGSLSTVRVKRPNRAFEDEIFCAHDFIINQRIRFENQDPGGENLLIIVREPGSGGNLGDISRIKLLRCFRKQKARKDIRGNNLA